MRLSQLFLLGLLALLLWSRPAHAASSYDNCAGFITTLPATISAPGTWCMKQDLSTAMTSGAAITIAADDVILDCNDFLLDGLAAGSGTAAAGVSANEHRNVRVRNCNIRGFRTGVGLNNSSTDSECGNVVEDSHFSLNTEFSVLAQGNGDLIRHNVILDTGTTASMSSTGIQTMGAVDIIDNTIFGLIQSNACISVCSYGIVMVSSANSSVIGNRIGGFPADGEGNGIEWQGSTTGRAAIRENEVLDIGGGTTSVGIYCLQNATAVRAHDNVIGGFHQSILSCTDAGENDSTP